MKEFRFVYLTLGTLLLIACITSAFLVTNEYFEENFIFYLAGMIISTINLTMGFFYLEEESKAKKGR